MPEPQSDTIIAVLHFAVTMLWVEKFKSTPNPSEEAKLFAKHVHRQFSHPPASAGPDPEWGTEIRLEMMKFFDHVAAQTLLETGRHDS